MLTTLLTTALTTVLTSRTVGMEDAMAYPLDYGYSLVGEVVAVGDAVESALLGKHAFFFAPHASAVVVPVGAIMVIPAPPRPVMPPLAPRHAIFLPSMETALSIVHDAHPRCGETVTVFGQGLIGLLVTSILARMEVVVVAVDLSVERQQLALSAGASVAMEPGAVPPASADVSIEVTGSPKGLQACIDGTRDHGRVVVASWYGTNPVQLTLGTRFHRSHISLVASQVSGMPAAVTGTWSKERRFAATFDLLYELPAVLDSLATLTVPLSEAPGAYRVLNAGGALTAVIDYSGDNGALAPAKL